jgi:outer membrane murein-binding lipoprotein Lpp
MEFQTTLPSPKTFYFAKSIVNGQSDYLRSSNVKYGKFMKLTSQELIEEEFLKDADSNEIIQWLRENAKLRESFYLYGDEFDELRRKYEPIWIERGENKLTIAICLYGKDIKTLKQLLFDNQLPEHFKQAILSNQALTTRGIETARKDSIWGEDKLTSEEVIDLYHQLKKENNFFFALFRNEGLDEEFLLDIFCKKPPYDVISSDHLLKIFGILFSHDRKFFSGRKTKYQNRAHKADARYLANAIIRFIPSIKDIGKNAELEAFASAFTLFDIKSFLEDTIDIDTDGIDDEETLTLFDVPAVNDSEDAHYFAELLPFIQSELAKRAFSGHLGRHKKEKLATLRQSNSVYIRGIYYRHADLTEIYHLGPLLVDKFLEALAKPNNDPFSDQDDGHPVKKEFPTTMVSLIELLQEEKHCFAAALALNKQHYKKKSRRDSLRSICIEADLIGGTFPWPLGNGTCIEVFNAQVKKLRETDPEFFKDETSENLLQGQVEALSRDVNQVKRHLEAPHNELLSAVSELNAKIDELQKQLSTASDSMLNELAQPRDVLSRFLFGLPLVGRIFKALFK